MVYNGWKNGTLPASFLIAGLKSQDETLKKIMNSNVTYIFKGLPPELERHDWLTLIMEKYGVIILITCLITFGIILLLISAVIYYRSKTRQSSHRIADLDKLYRNVQSSVGIDLNPAVVILQEEMNAKPASNGEKMAVMDDDDGWLAPIGDVPLAEDANAPPIQDTKL